MQHWTVDHRQQPTPTEGGVKTENVRSTQAINPSAAAIAVCLGLSHPISTETKCLQYAV